MHSSRLRRLGYAVSRLLASGLPLADNISLCVLQLFTRLKPIVTSQLRPLLQFFGK